MGVVSCGTTMLDQGVFQNIGAVTWDTTAKTSGFTAVSGNGYFCNTTSAAFTVTLPSSPSAGDIVGIKDYANTADTNNITIDRNGSNLDGGATNKVLNVAGRSVLLIYVDATKGWLITSAAQASDLADPVSYITATGGTISTVCTDYKVHVFTGPGTFCVSAGSGPLAVVDYMVIGGAGGAGGGGSGAGGFRESSGAASGCYSASPLGAGVSALPISVGGYPVVVGGGGAIGTPDPRQSPGTNGSNSSFSTITSAGGGFGGGGGQVPGGGSPSAPGPVAAGGPGGSGGGSGASNVADLTTSGGTGNTPPVAPPQGNNGGPGQWRPGSWGATGGGGGATGVGSTWNCGESVTGGTGATTSITATPTLYARGGPAPTTANSGNGKRLAAGDSGVVVIRYKFQ